ncbi:hypothetical protein M422DRAFT_162174 [Sphaerobolus stellatus SS14]|nr:hypothetical protein M422DRAFT_162174 [Sphaerobolus stellatus SS14]
MYNEKARILKWRSHLPVSWKYSFQLDYRVVGNSFFIYGLLNWHHDRVLLLQVPHKAKDQAERWTAAIVRRNHSLAGTGQLEWNHTCNICTKYTFNENGILISAYRFVVIDGISLRHPCCAMHNCQNPLPNSQHRYCNKHADRGLRCAVSSCDEFIERGFLTCKKRTHHQAEEWYSLHGKSIFPICDDKPASSHRKVHACFGRRRTNNEQIATYSCGMIAGRAAFYGAEGVHSVLEYLKSLYPTKSSLPSVIWFNNNCTLSAHLAHQNETYFDRVALPVDVFHFKSKHKETDEFCDRNCNPVLWPQLYNMATKEWTFNSSAAEQTNSWIVGFKSMTRLMRKDRYNPILDEVIIRKNAYRKHELQRQGQVPYSIPRQSLLQPEHNV